MCLHNNVGAWRPVLPGASFLGERGQNSQGSRLRRQVPDWNAVLISSAATLYILTI